MIIRKMYFFESAHILRDCSSIKCKSSIHGHSYKCEVLFSSNFLDNGEMVYDFGLMSNTIKKIIDAFDHSMIINSKDDENFKSSMKIFSPRWVEIPFNPSAEQLSRIFFVLIDKIFHNLKFKNNEKEINLHSIIIHETKSGYAQCFRDDAYNSLMGEISIDDIKFSTIDVDFFDKIKKDEILEFKKDI